MKRTTFKEFKGLIQYKILTDMYIAIKTEKIQECVKRIIEEKSKEETLNIV